MTSSGHIRLMTLAAALSFIAALGACDSDDDDDTNSQVDGAVGGSSGGNAQTPPTGAAAVDSWLATRSYASWHCEPEPHAARSPSPHGKNRICTNDVLSSNSGGPYAKGAAAVKELFDGSGNLAGHAVALHAGDGNQGGDWYWYEKMGSTVAVDGRGDSGVAKMVCVGCHQGAGSDAAHPGHDFVYTQVR
jgi:hypothetical protein